jgi:hypothetical protein
MKKTIWRCPCGCGMHVWEEKKKLWVRSDTIKEEQVFNLRDGQLNGKHSIMQPLGAAEVQIWLDAQLDRELMKHMEKTNGI